MAAVARAVARADRALIAIITVVCAGGCFRPRTVDCVLACEASSQCPSQMTCAGGMCTSGPTCVATVAAGETHTCAVLGPWLKCWGGNHAGQLGQGDRQPRGDGPGEMGANLPPVSLGVGRYVLASFAGGAAPLALGSGHTCVVLDSGDVKCWGDNRMGQLGLGDLRERVDAADLGDNLPAVDLGRGRKAVSLAAGVYHTCALLADGDIKCWGDNRFGQLGSGTPGNRGGRPGDMGDNLAPVNLGPGARASVLTAGAYHTCAGLVGDGAVKCWGWNEYGQLGVGDSRPRGLLADDMGSALPAVPLGLGRGATRIAAGSFHTCALLDRQDELKCWGYNGAGQLGRGSLGASEPIGVQTVGRSPVTEGDLQPVLFAPERAVRAIAAGSGHSCALLDDHSVRCWGLNLFGQLGIGNTNNSAVDGDEMGVPLPPVTLGGGDRLVSSISAGANHTCAVHGPAVTCWGLNVDGRLGVGDTDPRGDGRGRARAVDLGHSAPL